MTKAINLSGLSEKIVKLDWKLEGDIKIIKRNTEILGQFSNFSMVSVAMGIYPRIYEIAIKDALEQEEKAQLEAITGMTIEECNLELLASQFGTFEVLNGS